MGEAKRRRFVSQEAAFGAAVSHVLRGTDDLNVVVGPLLCRPTDGTAAKYWYFVVACSEKGRGFRCDQFIVDVKDKEEMRSAFIHALIRRRPIVIHDMDDEVSMVRMCEALWPGERISLLRKAVEEEKK